MVTLHHSAVGSLRNRPSCSLGNVLAVLEKIALDCDDELVPVHELSMDARDGSLVLGSRRRLHLQDLALSQLGNKIGVPGSYLQRCDPELRAHNVNRWLRERSGRLLLRMERGQIRAVLSERYRAVDNLDFVRMLGQALPESTPVRCELDDQQLVLQFLSSTSATDHAGGLIPGIHAGNSEVGASSIWLSCMAYRVVCANGLILSGQEVQYRRRHVGTSSLAERIAVKVVEMRNMGTAAVSRFSDTRNIRVNDQVAVFDRVESHYGLTSNERAEIDAAYLMEPGSTLFHTINAITRAGNSESLALASRTRLQEVGGRVVTAAESGSRWLN